MTLYIKGPDSGGNCCECSARTNPCDSCTTNACSCALTLPPLGGQYVSLAAAQAVLNSSSVSNCIGYIVVSQTLTSFVATDGINQLDFVGSSTRTSSPSISNQMDFYGGMTLGASTTLSIAYTNNSDGSGGSRSVQASLYMCDPATGNFSVVATNSGGGTSGSFNLTVAQEGVYFVLISCVSLRGASTQSVALTLTSSVLITNPIVANYNDVGTTRQLSACPKLLLPALTEKNGDWYASCAAAAAILNDALQVSSCIGFFDSSAPISSFSASGGSSISVNADYSAETGDSGIFWFSLNAIKSSTLSINFSTNQTGDKPSVCSFNIYDYNGNLIESLSSFTFPCSFVSSLTSSALPYTGKYIVSIELAQVPLAPICGFVGPFTNANFSITSSNTMSVNQIQALFDTGYTCPSRLDCGDSC